MESFGNVYGQVHLGSAVSFGYPALIVNSYGYTTIILISQAEWNHLRDTHKLVVEG